MSNLEDNKPEFWESNFKEKQEMWGFEPANSAVWTKDFFIRHSIKDILIPGIGYGRNAKIFQDNGMTVTGIEISETAIALARKHFGTEMTIHHGSVTEMPFDEKQYAGIFCYALIHLLDTSERKKLIRDCYNQLNENGWMVFTAISKTAPSYGNGKEIGKDRFEQFGGVNIFFYDEDSIREEFREFGLMEIIEIEENLPMFLIVCRK
ncbi:class I SAM-dependent methyltransferase [Fluviicola taffensis]|uniref:class I SAM-dependent methyltransferase n=1 Tax=Fluviicola taffensis TaxID=191579 RepID=UPI0031384018